MLTIEMLDGLRVALAELGIGEAGIQECIDYVTTHEAIMQQGISVLEFPEIITEIADCLRSRDQEKLSMCLFRLRWRAKSSTNVIELYDDVFRVMPPDVQEWWNEICTCGKAIGPHRHD